jgi:hypothetical protein
MRDAAGGIFLPKTDEVIAGCRTLHNEELHHFYCSSNLIRIIMPGNVAGMAEKRNAYRVLGGNPEVSRPLRTLTRRWNCNNKVGRIETSWDGMDWTHLT